MTLDAPNECCQQEANREVVRKEPHLEVQRCKVCGRNHYTAIMDPITPARPAPRPPR